MPILISALLAFSAIVVIPIVDDMYNLGKLLVLAVIGIISVTECFRRNIVDKNAWAWAIFFLAAATSTILSQDLLASVCGIYFTGWETLVALVCIWGCYHAGMVMRFDKFKSFLYYASIISAVYAILPFTPRIPPDMRAAGMFGQPVFSAPLIVIGIILGIEKWKNSAIDLLAMSAFAVTLWLMDSRGALLGLAAGIWVLISRRLSWKESVFFGALTLIGIGILLIGAHPASDSMRYQQIRAAWLAFKHSPIVGWGPGNYMIGFCHVRDAAVMGTMGGAKVVQVNAHNLPANILATQGIVGMIAWTILIYVAGRRLKGTGVAIGAVLGIVAMVTPLPPPYYAILAAFAGRNGKTIARGHILPIIPAAIAAIVVAGMFHADIYSHLGSSSRKVSAHDKAAGFYAKAVRFNPAELTYRIQYCSDADHIPSLISRSIVMSMSALRTHPGNAMGYAVMASALVRAGHMKEARNMAELALMIDPYNRGVALMLRRHDYE